MTFTKPTQSGQFTFKSFADLCEHSLAPIPVAHIGRDEASDAIVESQHFVIPKLQPQRYKKGGKKQKAKGSKLKAKGSKLKAKRREAEGSKQEAGEKEEKITTF